MRSRITSVAVFATVIAVLLFGLPLAWAAATINRTDERAELERLALRTSSGIDPGYGGREPIDVPSTEAGVAVGVYDTGGQRVGGVGPAVADSAVSTALRGSYVQGVVLAGQTVVAVPVRSGETVIAAVRASSATSVVSRRTWLTWLAMSGLALLAVGAAALVARWQARRLAAPLEQVAAVALAWGHGDLAMRAEPVGVSEIDVLAGALNRSADRLMRMLEHERSFAADASHQLRTPLTGLKWTLEAALADPDADVRLAATTAVATADELERAVTDLLALARYTGDRPRTELGPILVDLERKWRGPLAATGRSIAVSREDDVPPVAVSPAAVRNILGVLLDNAHRHGRGAVRIRVREVADAVAVDVADEGRPELDGARIFRRADPGATDHGLGLALARRLAEADGGRLVLASTSGPTTFTLLMPATEVPADSTGALSG